ncbi:MAG: response regulator [Gammaproteobacteria bacterium]|jgi:signal transduction histidine kinase/DNA-binding response OmpR family regulator|nr:response regulator [Gammaproteobacteria bacterium]MBT4608153.1 response regulator [Thiotrichales bacterium]MBT3966921.1 response regulator [Gammaproteobacteria bacterium]MBT4080213.1 response regulator [Gammaproteobacteria bacterium]MBT4811249.1 response regulator [Thiotrichales bacterium]
MSRFTRFKERFFWPDSTYATCGLAWSNHFILDHPLIQSITNGTPEAIGLRAETLRKESTADAIIILDIHGTILYHSFTPERLGASLMSWNIVRNSLLGESLDSSIVQDLDNFIIYSPSLVSDNLGEIIGLVLVGYAINDHLLQNISQESQIEITLVRRRAVMASTFSRPESRMSTIPLSYISYQSMLQNPKSIKSFEYGGIEYLAIARRLSRMAKNQEGSILLTFPRQGLNEVKQRLLWEYGILFFVEFFLIALISARFSGNLLRPIYQLIEQIEQSDKTQELQFTSIDSGGEIGIIANRFNQLVGTIHKQNSKLRNYSASLEQKVEERSLALKNAYETLARKERSLTHAQHIAKIGSWEWEIHSDHLHCSEEMLKICDIPTDQFGGTLEEFTNTLAPNQRESFTIELRHSARAASTFHGEYTVYHKNGDEYALLIETEITEDSEGNPTAVSGTIQDITERKLAEVERQQYQERLEDLVAVRTSQLREEKERAEAANEAKDNFLAAMSHELRTPLTTIIGNSEFLAEQETNKDKQELISAIETAGRGQLALVNDILDISKIESGKFTIDEAPYEFSVLLQDIQHMLTTRAHDAGLTLEVKQTNQEKHLLIGDAQRISQILINLIGNAIKFTESGSITLTTRANNHHLIFQVKDSGIGMSPDTVDHLFQRFEQADGSISRRFGGSGLGLFISESLADMMGGVIDASSREGEGSIFELILPYQPSTLLARKGQNHSETRPVLNKQLEGHVLIAEDTPELQLLERRILEGMGMTVSCANNGEEAVELATQQSFDLILMDMQMPIMDGIEATQALRQRGYKHPIVALTANVMQKHQDAFNSAGCNAFLAKPIDKQKLYEILEQCISDRHHTPDPAVDEEVGEEVDDELMTIFKASAANNKKILTDALHEKEWNNIRQVAHNIKGSGASFGLPNLSLLGKVVCDAIDEGESEQLSQQVTDLIIELEKIEGTSKNTSFSQ